MQNPSNQPLPTNFQASGALGPLVKRVDQLFRMVNNFVTFGPCESHVYSDKITLRVYESGIRARFRQIRVEGADVTFAAGAMHVGNTRYDVAETTITLTAATEYLFIDCPKWTGPATWKKSSIAVDDTSDNYRRVMYKYVASGSTWALDEIWHIGDIWVGATTDT